MHRFASALVALAVVTPTPIAVQKAPATFAGTWVLNKAKSQGASPGQTEADKVQWTIVQDEKTISINEEIAGGRRPGSGSLCTYRLDGVESALDMGNANMAVTLRAKWTGARLDLMRKQSVTGPTPMETNASRILALSGDGKVLTVTMHYESSRGKSDSTLVFDRQ